MEKEKEKAEGKKGRAIRGSGRNLLNQLADCVSNLNKGKHNNKKKREERTEKKGEERKLLATLANKLLLAPANSVILCLIRRLDEAHCNGLCRRAWRSRLRA